MKRRSTIGDRHGGLKGPGVPHLPRSATAADTHASARLFIRACHLLGVVPGARGGQVRRKRQDARGDG